ncbi:MAG TPA: hypothetical protein VK028_14190, partial [Micromonosporaceae bacterium]|nr:hypothetical protein [Micromonosporaceae bacterium]
MTIRTRITLVGVGVVTLVICCLSGTLFTLISRGLDTGRDAELAARLDELMGEVATASADDLTPVRPLAPIDPRSSMDILIMVLGEDGSVLHATGEVSVPSGVLAEARRSGQATVDVPVTGGAPGETVRVMVRPWSRSDLQMSGYAVA